jgi:hypothetical protein
MFKINILGKIGKNKSISLKIIFSSILLEYFL